jgi:proliferating cell nuclear antigen PCNA
MTIIFKAKSEEAYVFKILGELLANNIKTGCFEVDEKGIFLKMMDHHRRILIDLKLHAENFKIYKFNTKKMFLGINVNHFHKMIKSIKKKDHIELSIDSENPTELSIKVIPKENNNNKITTSYVKIQSIQNLDIDIPGGYNNHISISSTDFQKIIKEMGSIGNVMKVVSKNYSIEFSCNSGGILKKKVSFGEDEEDDDDPPKEFIQEFFMDQLCRISKLSGLSNNIQIYPGKPLYFKSSVGKLGVIGIYIKSKEEIETETCTLESEYDSDE